MRERGFSLVEMVVVVAILMVLAAVFAPNLKAYAVDAHLLGAGRQFKEEFLKARSLAVKTGVQTAIRFERRPDGAYFSVYADGNFNGVLAAEIATGTDVRVAGPFVLSGGAPDVRVAINPGTPAIPPQRGLLDTSDPIRFGRSDMLSFSPLGTASPGTFYLAGVGQQAAVRVNPGTSRVSFLSCRGAKWRER
jgi:prepilin-type N-terminal cleavage/methylation domain-containing protein